jgi:hypothetical protein
MNFESLFKASKLLLCVLEIKSILDIFLKFHKKNYRCTVFFPLHKIICKYFFLGQSKGGRFGGVER